MEKDSEFFPERHHIISLDCVRRLAHSFPSCLLLVLLLILPSCVVCVSFSSQALRECSLMSYINELYKSHIIILHHQSSSSSSIINNNQSSSSSLFPTLSRWFAVLKFMLTHMLGSPSPLL